MDNIFACTFNKASVHFQILISIELIFNITRWWFLTNGKLLCSLGTANNQRKPTHIPLCTKMNKLLQKLLLCPNLAHLWHTQRFICSKIRQLWANEIFILCLHKIECSVQKCVYHIFLGQWLRWIFPKILFANSNIPLKDLEWA